MGKRSEFKPRPQDKYFTPKAGVIPLLPFLGSTTAFAEPCGGDGRLARFLEEEGHQCVWLSDVAPDDEMKQLDALDLTKSELLTAEMIITNPPWSRDILHELIDFLPTLKPTWLLFDADWMHTVQAASLIKTCSQVVSIGRLKWIEDSKYTGKDNCCWYFFPGGDYQNGPRFTGRLSKSKPTSLESFCETK